MKDRVDACFSISASWRVSKFSSQPTSTRTFTPPSNSRSDCEAWELLCAPRRGVNVNMVLVQGIVVQRVSVGGD